MGGRQQIPEYSGLAFVVYWGIVLFGYNISVGGGIVNHPYFQHHFGMYNANGTKNTHKVNSISSNVVSSFQAGAYFGALGSVPISPKLGRIYTLLVYSLLFCIGAILTTAAESPSNGLALIYSGRAISGVGIDGISAVALAYVSECSPKEVRGRITGLFQIMLATGGVLSYFINYGIGVHISSGANVWRIPFSIQLVPAGIMTFGLLTVKESPRWLASVNRKDDALKNLAYLRKLLPASEQVLHEMAEIQAVAEEERFAREAVNYYAPQIFESIGYTGTRNSLLASEVFGIVKLVSSTLLVFFGIEWLGRKLCLIISAFGMGTLFYIVGALLRTHPPPVTSSTDTSVSSPDAVSQATAAMIYIYVCFYCLGWGPLPWVYVLDIFPTRTRHYGLALGTASQWLWSFVVSKTTPDMISNLGWKFFITFATVDIGAMGLFLSLIPETKGRSLEDMDVIFGAISKEERDKNIIQQEHGQLSFNI
ncbi:general substrate transporter [Armillaria luteobubalina]|uniref:General substrate transporter n=1 Tax=Armillaria luteobubalina TaxID=153913 RepID=A0AA39QCU4_9AGAR|nr:general substrate transporter [Armillaria luteobubalina]